MRFERSTDRETVETGRGSVPRPKLDGRLYVTVLNNKEFIAYLGEQYREDETIRAHFFESDQPSSDQAVSQEATARNALGPLICRCRARPKF